MKKLIILAVICLTTTISFAQVKLYAYLLETGTWNRYTDKWEYSRLVNTSLEVTVNKTYISVNDQAGTFLSIDSYEGETIGKTSDGVKYKAVRWNCTDELRRNCLFSMVEYEDDTYLLTVMYNNLSYRYYIRANKLSNF
jgi:hypothetical protein